MSNDERISESGMSLFGCLGMLGIAMLLLGLLVLALRFQTKRDQAVLEREQQERRERQVASVRGGSGNVDIRDGKMVEMLLDDPVCREAVTSIDFTMADLGDPRFRRVREFPNVTRVFFYCCDNADNVMSAARDMPAIESLFFEVTEISDESMRSLADFPCLKELHFEQVMPDARIEALHELVPDVEIEACLESELLESVNHQETTKSE
jgi:hypothetical protein